MKQEKFVGHGFHAVPHKKAAYIAVPQKKPAYIAVPHKKAAYIRFTVGHGNPTLLE